MLHRSVTASPCMEWPKAGCMCFMIAFHSRHTNLQVSNVGRSVTCCKISTYMSRNNVDSLSASLCVLVARRVENMVSLSVNLKLYQKSISKNSLPNPDLVGWRETAISLQDAAQVTLPVASQSLPHCILRLVLPLTQMREEIRC